ncbi:MAG TPA: PPE domain-containing protein, partial [Pseudonocardiaceae bacterium]
MSGENGNNYPMMCRNWMAISHRQLYDDIHTGPGPAGTQGTQQTYARIGALFAQTDQDIQTGLRQLGVAYEGAGSSAAQSGITVLRQWTTDAQYGSIAASDVVGWQADSYSYARDTMPEPVPVTAQDGFFDQVYDFFGGTTAREEQEEQARQAHQWAAQVMSEYDVNSGEAANAMPTFVPPPSVTVDVPAATESTSTIGSNNKQVTQTGGPVDPPAGPPATTPSVSQTPTVNGTGNPPSTSTTGNPPITGIGPIPTPPTGSTPVPTTPVGTPPVATLPPPGPTPYPPGTYPPGGYPPGGYPPGTYPP